MMTTPAALFGVLLLAIGGGTDSELRQPLGLTIAVVYLYLDRVQSRVQRVVSAAPLPEPLAEP
jgi:hypothetical protein